ncbi:WYL domain-containing protein [Motilibacter peucedani]|uniref:WYL domain-containing protein n=1 Tax=Motilibacter peucedani TaxID=598650 RepID=A0A420XKG0_9ACTN|nr:helicase-associated domain-containing protein [Motilibacter peucedani]RKS68516.1 WYL domain-containing protein [Motilibacter peucedani]
MTDRGAPVRSLADDLRARDDAALAALLRARPDLLGPVPADVGALATRATSAPSVARALDRLDLAGLQVVEVLATLPEPTTAAEVTARWGADARAVLAVLREQALVWGEGDEVRLVRAVRTAVREPAGLGPPVETLLTGASPEAVASLVRALGASTTGDVTRDAAAVAAVLSDAAALDALLAGAPPGAREALARLEWGPPAGALPSARRQVDPGSARTPVEWLLAHGLLVPTGPETVTLPLEVALHLRGGRVHADPAPVPPALATTERGVRSAEQAAAQAAYDLVRRCEDLLESWGLAPPAVLRQGGLSVRDLKRTAVALDVDEPTAALVVETAHSAGLFGPSLEGDEWLPGPAYDTWLAQPVERRWAVLAQAWLASTRVASLAGARDERDKPLNALGPGLDRALAPDLRTSVLTALADVGAGLAVERDSLLARLTWHRPRRAGRSRDALVGWTLAEAEVLGVTGRGALSAAGRRLLDSDEDAVAAALAPGLPEPSTEILLQADLTVVAPGPLVPALAREIALMADVESTGGATVYRLTADSVRRALDAGRSSGELLELLTTHSRTPVPQPLAYLLEDVARRHGRVRVGTASAYLRCDDPAVLTELVADRRAAQLRLRRLAPTVLAAQAPVDMVLERLRSLGLAPAAESAEGEVVVRRPDSRRSPHRPRPPRLVGEPPAPPDGTLAAAVRAVRAGDRAAASVRRDPRLPASSFGVPRVATAEVVALLRQAVQQQVPVVIGYVNAEASATERVVEPMSVEGGYVTAFDHLTDSVRTFAVARITGIAPAANAPA